MSYSGVHCTLALRFLDAEEGIPAHRATRPPGLDSGLQGARVRVTWQLAMGHSHVMEANRGEADDACDTPLTGQTVPGSHTPGVDHQVSPSPPSARAFQENPYHLFPFFRLPPKDSKWIILLQF